MVSTSRGVLLITRVCLVEQRCDPTDFSADTSHVPCKFFRVGTCQAGSTCVFSHSMDTAAEVAPCKYFAKVVRLMNRKHLSSLLTIAGQGNCKFGHKCMLAHVLPDGRRVNRPNLPTMSYQSQTNPRGHMLPYMVPTQEFGSESRDNTRSGMLASPGGDGRHPPQDSDTMTSQYHGSMEAGYSSWPTSPFGSPPRESRLPLSPSLMPLSALDATLPGSFDGQGISHFARHGPVAASVPSRFGLESVISTSPPTSATPTLAFGNLDHIAAGDFSRYRRRVQVPTTPPQPLGDILPRKAMYSERVGSNTQLISSSLGARPIVPLPGPDDEDDHFQFEEDLVPDSLQELLTPQEKMRRFSRSEEESALSARFSHTTLSSSGTSKGASPTTTSPSRYASVFAQRKEDPDMALLGPSAFGHVGSPLRNSSLKAETGVPSRAVMRPRSRETSYVSSPPRSSNLSILLQKNSLNPRSGLTEGSTPLPPLTQRSISSSSISSTLGGSGPLMRATSSSSVGHERISEQASIFTMEEEVEEQACVNGIAYSEAGGRATDRQHL